MDSCSRRLYSSDPSAPSSNVLVLFERLLHEVEGPRLDFKRDQYPLTSNAEKGEFVKDILAFANSWRTTDAFILVGVEETKVAGKSTLVGVSTHLKDSDIQQLVKNLKQGNTTSLYKEKFIVSVRNNWIPVNTADIACFMRDNLNYLFTFSGEKYIMDFTTLDEVEELLDPQKFYRANRQYIVHVDAIQSVKPFENSKLRITLKTPLKFDIDISREKAPAFKKWLDR